MGPDEPWTDCGGSASPTAIWLRALKAAAPPSIIGAGADCRRRRRFGKAEKISSGNQLRNAQELRVFSASCCIEEQRIQDAPAASWLWHELRS